MKTELQDTSTNTVTKSAWNTKLTKVTFLDYYLGSKTENKKKA